jgi:ABC-type Fe3+-citrate transport system substrate-binding protein
MKQSIRYVWIICLLLLGSSSYAQENMTCDSSFQAVEDATGTVSVPKNPVRVVALEWTYMEDVLTLGVQPVGVADIEGYHNWVDISVELGDDVVDVGTRQAPNLELIAELEPDLIIAFKDSSLFYEGMETIAPLVVYDAAYATDWKYRAFDRYVLESADLLPELSIAEQFTNEYLLCVENGGASYDCMLQVDPSVANQ